MAYLKPVSNRISLYPKELEHQAFTPTSPGPSNSLQQEGYLDVGFIKAPAVEKKKIEAPAYKNELEFIEMIFVHYFIIYK